MKTAMCRLPRIAYSAELPVSPDVAGRRGAGSVRLVRGANGAGATAATLTSTVGFVYIRVLSTLFANASGKPPSDDQVADAFAKALLEQIHEQEN